MVIAYVGALGLIQWFRSGSRDGKGDSRMDIAALSMSMATTENLSKIGTAVLDKTMETNEQLGEGLVEMIDSAAMERSVNPAVGGNYDLAI